jgi:hypothetical protein
MTRRQVRDFIKAGVNAINPQMPFGSGKITEWNSNRSNEYPGTWLELGTPDTELVTATNMPFDNTPIRLHIGKKDAAGSSPDEYEALVDECDEIAQQLIFQYNNSVIGYKLAVISSISREPFYHRHADDITGVILIFTLTDPATKSRC